MKLKLIGIIGLLFLLLNQVLLLKGNEFIQAQAPIDYVHWLLLIGALMTLSLNHIFSDNNFSSLATILTSLGVVALIGQATIDFLWWSYGSDYEGMNSLTNQIMSRPSIRIPFMTIGPGLFYFGMAAHAAKLFRSGPIWALATFMGVILVGMGAFGFDSRMTIVLGHVLLSTGLIVLMFTNTQKKTI